MIPFRKMQGLGNDFVVFDAREKARGPDDGAMQGDAPLPTVISASAATRWC